MANSHQQAVEHARGAHEAALKSIWATAKKIKKDASLTRAQREDLLSELYAPLGTKDVVTATADDIHKYQIGVSFRSSISHIRHVKRRLSAHGYRIALGSNPKMEDRRFAQELGVPTPKTLVHGVLPADLPTTPNTIIKPVRGAGAMGVYYVDSNLTVRSMRSHKQYTDVPEALSELKGKPILDEPVWLAEEVILGDHNGPAHDLKAYAFYGKVAFFMEVSRGVVSEGKSAFCFYDVGGNIIDIGRHGIENFAGGGLPDDIFEQSRLLSLESPVPFLRIDFHKGAEQTYFGEITPHPADTYAGDIADRVDKSLGREFVEAEARLWGDLLKGKTFGAYFASYTRARPK